MTASGGDKRDAIVAGAGLGGLGCATVLSKSGLKVLVLERHNKVGGYALTRALSSCIEDTGSEILTRAQVARIKVEDGRCVGVQTKKGEKYEARVIVSNSPAPLTFDRLVDPSVVDPSYLEETHVRIVCNRQAGDRVVRDGSGFVGDLCRETRPGERERAKKQSDRSSGVGGQATLRTIPAMW